ncbi:MAG: arginine--tRNA ligase [Alphaproteobacteria bacterium]|jgi:arginyl-tRNA synthetase|nr:arginine--tRNA ligase [Alphaproteobacteria bacterium]MDP6517976.1 arginine--tRNA ligase [Alphaproteobacteria bacterium]
MNIFNLFEGYVRAELEQCFGAKAASGAITVEPPRDPSHGDLATNAALARARAVGAKPGDLAEALAAGLARLPDVVEVRIAGPGFINLRLADRIWHQVLADVLAAQEDYGRSDIGARAAVNIEFVSANPTGPLHVGHCRGAVYGDALARLLEFTGFAVTREYYVNDAGTQIEQLAHSAYVRYREALGEEISEDVLAGLGYGGNYLKDVGAGLKRRYGDEWAGAASEDWLPVVRGYAIEKMMDDIRADLAALGIAFDQFSSELDLVAAGKVDAVLADFTDRDLVYTGVLAAPKGKTPDDWEPRPQTLFRATRFGDDVDRPLRKSDGSWTYFATDIANHLDKYQRGFRDMINVWGADHGGYVKRMKAAVKAFGDGDAALDVKLCQMVRLFDGGVPAKMSKRTGSFVTLRELVEAVGRDVVRFFMLTRRNDAPLDFDLVKVREQSRDNPVFYVQYAHARICSVKRNLAGGDMPAGPDKDPDLARLTHPDELSLIRMMAAWPRQVEAAAVAHEPHRLAFALYDLAAAFHGLWNKGNEDRSLRFIVDDDPGLTDARLALIEGVRLVIASGLDIFGVTPVEEMR